MARFTRSAVAIVAVTLAVACFHPTARAQMAVPGGMGGSEYELSDSVGLDKGGSAVHAQYERIRIYAADGQWDEAVQTLREVVETSGNRLVGVTERRFISVRDYGNLQLTSLPLEALALYRSRVDAFAKDWYEEGARGRDRRKLLDVVEQAFASSWGDNALNALGEIALESGDYAAARSYWEKIIPVEPSADPANTWLSVADTDLDLAAVRARLVLTSIVEGSRERAREELETFRKLHGDARGRLGGQEGRYADTLAALLGESAAWPEPVVASDWPTFAGSALRHKIASDAVDPVAVAWRLSLRPSLPANQSVWNSPGPTPRVAEDPRTPLAYHPIVSDGLVLVNNQVEILALDAKSGDAAFGLAEPQIYRDQFAGTAHKLYQPEANLGVPRFTMTARDGRLYARMGPSVTSYAGGAASEESRGYLVCLDLRAEGRLLWKIQSDEATLAFEGSPISDGSRVYVALRRTDIQPQALVACYDAEDGRLLWRQFVCRAETPARGMFHETTHNLLTLHRDTLYFNTNLGAVAALSADDGRVKWVSLYPRARKGDLLRPTPHESRDLNPCLFDRGRLIVAPSDSRRIFGLDAATGQVLWQTPPELDDVVHLLGVAGDHLIASGQRLYWISLRDEGAGAVAHVWPDGAEKLGYGRGVLAGDDVFWPTRDKILVFEQLTGKQKRVVPLATRGAEGGNLVVAAGQLFITTDDELIALGNAGPASPSPPDFTRFKHGSVAPDLETLATGRPAEIQHPTAD